MPKRPIETTEQQIDYCLIAGNHLAAALIGQTAVPFHGWTEEQARRGLSLDMFDVWIAWRMLMDVGEKRRNSPVIPEGPAEQRDCRLKRLDNARNIAEGQCDEDMADRLIKEYPDTWKKQYRTPAGPWTDAEVNP